MHGSVSNRIAACLVTTSCAKKDTSGSVVVWGNHYEVPSPNKGFVAIASGASHSLGLKAPKQGMMRFKSALQLTAENKGSVRICVSRAGGSYGTVSVKYATSDGTAKAGSDYKSTSGTLTWSDGDMADKYIDVTILNDKASESSETLTVTLSSADGAILGSPYITAVTIADDDSFKL